MKVQYFLEVGIPPRKDGIDGSDLTLWSNIPFVPPKGTLLKVAEDDVFREVQTVYWEDNGWFEGLLQVFFKFGGEVKNLKALTKLGWKEADK